MRNREWRSGPRHVFQCIPQQAREEGVAVGDRVLRMERGQAPEGDERRASERARVTAEAV